MLTIGPSGSEKNNALLNFNLIQQDNDSLIDKIPLYAKDLSEPKYQFLIEKREDARIKNSNAPISFIEYSNTMDDVYDNIDNYNPRRKRKILIVFDDMIADRMTNKRFQAIIKELLIRCRKLNTSIVLITQYYYSVPKEVRLNSTYNLTMKIHNKREFQQIAINHSVDINYKYLLLYSFLTIDTTLLAENPLRFRKNLSDSSL